MLYSYFFNMLKVGVPGATQVPQLLVYNHKKLLRVSPEEHPRKCRAGSIITCTIGQVGRLSSVSLLPTSDVSREACNPQIQIGIPY